MTAYNLFTAVTKAQVPPPIAVEGGPAPANLPAGCTAVNPGGGAGAPTVPPTSQTFQLNLTGSGNCAATAQILGSNDGINWLSNGQVVITSGGVPSSNALAGTNNYAWFAAYLLSIAGTNATASLIMNA